MENDKNTRKRHKQEFKFSPATFTYKFKLLKKITLSRCQTCFIELIMDLFLLLPVKL